MSFGLVAASYLSTIGEAIQPLAAWNFENEVEDSCADVAGNGYVLTRGELGDWTTGHNSACAPQGYPGNVQGRVGSGAYGVCPGGSPGGNPLTVCFWAQLPDVAVGATCVAAMNDSGRVDPWAIGIESDGSVQAVWFSDTDVISGSPAGMSTGVAASATWCHIAGVFTPGVGVTLHVNGTIVTTYNWQSGSSAFYGTWETLLVGSSRWGSAGVIVDDLRIYHQALTSAHITTLMNQAV